MSPTAREKTGRSHVFCYYVSGHGFGHATRVVRIAIEILALSRQHSMYIISNAPQFIFKEALDLGAKYRHALIDAGVRQPVAYTVDRHQTIHDLQAFLKKRQDMLDREANWLREIQADIVLSDAPFLPCAAAAIVGIPSSIVSNFTFDAVYLGLCEGDDLDIEIKQLVDQVIADYQKAELLVRLPGYIPIPAFAGTQLYPEPKIAPMHSNRVKSCAPKTIANNVRHVVDVPLVVRKSRNSRDIVLKNLGIPRKIFKTHKVLLVSFGGQNLQGVESWGSSLPDGWIAIACGSQGVEGKVLPKKFYKCPVDAYIPDLTNAADVIIGKLGYGTCSECIGHAKPFIYVPRPQFIEEQGLKRLMETQGSCVEMSREDFESGRWANYILRAEKMQGVCENVGRRLTHNGGTIAARTLERFLDNWYLRKEITSLDMNHDSNQPLSICKASV